MISSTRANTTNVSSKQKRSPSLHKSQIPAKTAKATATWNAGAMQKNSGRKDSAKDGVSLSKEAQTDDTDGKNIGGLLSGLSSLHQKADGGATKKGASTSGQKTDKAGPAAAVDKEGTSANVDGQKTWDIDVGDRFRNFGHKSSNGQLWDKNGNWKDSGTAISKDQIAAMSDKQRQAFFKSTGIDPKSFNNDGNATNATEKPPANWKEVVKKVQQGQAEQARGAGSAKKAQSSGSSIKGIDPIASDALRKAGFTSNDVTQGLGRAKASAGTHEAEPGSKYTASVDLRTRGKSNEQIGDMLKRLRKQGFAAWYRGTDRFKTPHIHAVYAGVPTKGITTRQVQDFIKGKDGLRGHRTETKFPPTAEEKRIVRMLFEQRNQRVAVQ